MITYPTFVRLYEEASGYSNLDMYVAERGWQEWMDEYDVDAISEILEKIYTISRMSMRELREWSGYYLAEMSRAYRIPLRTLENWNSGKIAPPEHFVLLFRYAVFVESFSRKEDD